MMKLCSRQQAATAGTLGAGTVRSFLAYARPAALLLPPTQFGQPAERYGHLALRARLSPANSLFNRLDTFVHELQKSRDFFSEWPHTLCQRIRRQEPTNEQQQAAHRRTNNHTTLPASSEILGSSTNCWNGRDFNGYNKPLVEFGKAITANHPEVPASHTNPVNTMVLNLVAKLKAIGAQLARKSVRSPHLSLYQSLGAEALSSITAQAGKLQLAPPSASSSDGTLPAESSTPGTSAGTEGSEATSDIPPVLKGLDLIRVIEAASQEDKEGTVDDSSSSGLDEASAESAEPEDSDSGPSEEDEEDGEEEDDVNCTGDCTELDPQTKNTGSNTISLDLPQTPLEPDTPALSQPPVPHHQHHHHHHNHHQQQQHHQNTYPMLIIPSSPLPSAVPIPSFDTTDTNSPAGFPFTRPSQINLGRPLVVVHPYNKFAPVGSNQYEPIRGNDIYPPPENGLIMMPPESNLRQSSGAASSQFIQFGPALLFIMIAFTLLVTTLCLRPKAIRLLHSASTSTSTSSTSTNNNNNNNRC